MTFIDYRVHIKQQSGTPLTLVKPHLDSHAPHVIIICAPIIIIRKFACLSQCLLTRANRFPSSKQQTKGITGLRITIVNG
ncbi:hypothetical protein HanIR_Chr02g0097601 [Helianthus annuus]|nr:hypothetical protein HanIR_Chr02g0097601 [Helianthus annuus]